jgi:hypothetical protein
VDPKEEFFKRNKLTNILCFCQWEGFMFNLQNESVAVLKNITLLGITFRRTKKRKLCR